MGIQYCNTVLCWVWLFSYLKQYNTATDPTFTIEIYTMHLSIPAGERYRKDCGDLCLPTFIDLAGINDEDKELCEELLRIVLYGCLPKGTLFVFSPV